MIEQTEYDNRYAELLTQSRAIEERIAEIGEQHEQRKTRKRELDAFYKALKATGPIMEFDEELWNVTVENLKINENGQFSLCLKNH